jgi:hypothetical protein
MNKAFIFVLSFALMLISSCDFKLPAFAGSYCYSENYHFDISDKELIDVIINFKIRYPQYQSSDSDYYESFDDREYVYTYYENGAHAYQVLGGYSDTLTEGAIWFHCHFYLSDIKAKVNCVINVSRQAIGMPTLLHLVSYFPDGEVYKIINQRGEISREENRMIKKKFETEILDHLGVKWRRQRW